MQIDERTAVVDNDFISHLAESRLNDDRLVDVLNIVFCELGLSAVMHPLVYDHELLKEHDRIRLLFDRTIICKAEFADIFLGDPNKKAYYVYLITNLYRSFTGVEFPFSGDDIFTHWIRRKSLGEVHSIVMCLICGCGIFLSDDGDSKALRNHVERMSIGTVDVYSRDEFINIHMQEGETKLNRKERKSLVHSSSN